MVGHIVYCRVLELAAVEEDDPFLAADERSRKIVRQLRTETPHLVAVVVVARVAGTVALGLPVPRRAVAPDDSSVALLKPSRLHKAVVEMDRRVAACDVQCAVPLVPERAVEPLAMLVVAEARAAVNTLHRERLQAPGRSQCVGAALAGRPNPVEVALPAVLLAWEEQPGRATVVTLGIAP
jgi:hypothetical protein